MAIDPAGQLLFVTNLDPGTVTTYTVNPSTGELVRGFAVTTGQNSRPVQPVVDPSGRYLYVADSNTSQVSGFIINGGNLTPMAGSPFAAGAGPSSVAASRTAVFVANQITGDVSVYHVGPEGGLTSAGVSVPTGGSPTSVAVDPPATTSTSQINCNSSCSTPCRMARTRCRLSALITRASPPRTSPWILTETMSTW